MSEGVERRIASSADEVVGLGIGGPGGYYASRQASGGLALRVDNLTEIRDGGVVQFDVEAEALLRFIAETASTFADPLTSVPDRDRLHLGPEGASQAVRSRRLDAAIGKLDEPTGLITRRSISVIAELALPFFGGWRCVVASRGGCRDARQHVWPPPRAPRSA